MPIRPQLTSIHLDSCAFDPKYSPEDKAAEELYRSYSLFKEDMEDGIILEIAHSKEIGGHNT